MEHVENYQIKSQRLIKASEMLIAGNFYDSSLHCSYYGVLQTATYLLLRYDYNGFDELKKTFAISNTKSKGSHQVIWSAIKHRAKRTRDRKALLKINNDIITLKQMREDADYSANMADEDTARGASRLAKDLITTLEEFYR